MKANAGTTSFFYGDLTAIALACIVSLLFAQGVCQFLNTAKKNNYHESYVAEASATSRIEVCAAFVPSVICQQRAVRREQSIQDFVAPAKSYQFIKTTISNVLNKGFGSFFTSLISTHSMPLLSGPSIPIVQRRLVI
jgi:hypothetical protein